MGDFTFSVQNIVDGQGIGIAVTGMLIVFAALLIISLFISLLPRMLPLLATILPEESAHHAPSKRQAKDDGEVLAAIGYTLFKLKANKRQND